MVEVMTSSLEDVHVSEAQMPQYSQVVILFHGIWYDG